MTDTGARTSPRSATMIRRHPSPLRYPGGKGKITNYMKLLILENGLSGCEYAEPFAGGASVALSLLYEELASHVYINDIDNGVHAFWSSALDETESLCELIQRTPLSIQEWQRQREILQDPQVDTLALGFATFYLNRTNRSGIIDGGVIGGQDQTGQWKIGARFDRDRLSERIRKAARFRNRITLTQQDGEVFVRSMANSPNLFLYIDPPYFVKGKGLYTNFYEPSDHAELASAVSTLNCPWVVSYDGVPEIRSLYRQYSQLEYSLSYSASSVRSKGNEIMFFSPGVTPPAVSSPANISCDVVDELRLEMLRS